MNQIRLKSGAICLFDTKTPGSDEDVVEKHNALQVFIDEYNAQGVKMVDGVLMAEGENWYYLGGKNKYRQNHRRVDVIGIEKQLNIH